MALYPKLCPYLKLRSFDCLAAVLSIHKFAGAWCTLCILAFCMLPTVPQCNLAMFWHFVVPTNCFYHHSCMCWKRVFLSHRKFQVITLPDTLGRHLLIRLGFWGQQQEPIRVHLHRAYLQFKAWCSLKKNSCSQPCFQEKLVPSRNLAHCYLFLVKVFLFFF